MAGDNRRRGGAALAGSAASTAAVANQARIGRGVTRATRDLGERRATQVRAQRAQVTAQPKPRPISTWAKVGADQGLSGGAARRAANAGRVRQLKRLTRNEQQARRMINAAHKVGGGAARTAMYGGGAAAAYLADRGARKLSADRVRKAYNDKDVRSGEAGAAAGFGAYHGFSYGSKPVEQRVFNRKIRARDEHDATYRAHRKASGVDARHAGPNEWTHFFRHYPKDLPGAKFKRTLGRTHGGRSGAATQLATIGAGAAVGVATHRRKKGSTMPNVAKASSAQLSQEHANEATQQNARALHGAAVADAVATGAVIGHEKLKNKIKNHPHPNQFRQAARVRNLKRIKVAGIAGTGAALGAGAAYGLDAAHHRRTAEKYRQIGKSASTQGSTMISAFGVEHTISKADRQPKHKASNGRLWAGAAFPGTHGAVAGKPGRKLRAAGHELAGAVPGSVIAGPIGSMAGGAIGTNIAHNKGYYKPQRKKLAKSAFGVDHPVSKSEPLTGQKGDKRNTKYVGAAYGGALAGGAAGRQAATRSAGTSPRAVGALVREKTAMDFERGTHDEHAQRIGNAKNVREGFSAGRKAGRAVLRSALDVPGGARMYRGGKVGAALGAAGGAGAYAAERHRKQAVHKSAFGVDDDRLSKGTWNYLAGPLTAAKGQKGAAYGTSVGNTTAGEVAGAGVGAGVGAAVGAATHNAKAGALIGGAAGLVGGGQVGYTRGYKKNKAAGRFDKTKNQNGSQSATQSGSSQSANS